MPDLVSMPQAVNGNEGGGAMKKPKMSKNQMRRAKKKEDKAKARESRETSIVTDSETETARPEAVQEPVSSEVEVDATSDVDENDPLWADFKGVFEKFQPGDEVCQSRLSANDR